MLQEKLGRRVRGSCRLLTAAGAAGAMVVGMTFGVTPAGAVSGHVTAKSEAYASTHSSGHYQKGDPHQGGGHLSGRATGRFHATLLSRPPVFTAPEKALQHAAMNRHYNVPLQSGNTKVPAAAVHIQPGIASATRLGGPVRASGKSPAAPTDLDGFRSTDVSGETNSGSSGVGEPSTANDGNVVLYTGNWYAALSTDSGNSFSFVNPYTLGPTPTKPNGGFCCDQAVIHAPAVGGTDVTAWVLLYCQQYSNCNGGDNIIRLAVARNQADLASATFDYYDFSAQDLGFPEGYNLDYPHLAANQGYLSLSINVYDNNNNFNTSLLMHFDESTFSTGSYSGYFYSNNQDFTWTPTDNSHDNWTYWAATAMGNGNLIRVYNWPPGTDYTHVAWNDFSVGFNYESRGGGSCTAPDGNNWCAFDDSRVKTGGEVGVSTAWFMWDAQQGNGAPYPYVEYASFDVSTGPATSVSPGYFAYNNTAVAYPGLGVDNNGDMALSVEFGGGGWGYPQSIFGIDDAVTGNAWGTWYGLNQSAAANNRWGDYLTARAAEYPGSTGNTWILTGYTLDASGNAHPAFYWLGRNSNDPWAPSPYAADSLGFTEGASAYQSQVAIPYGPSNCTCDYYVVNNWGDGTSSEGSLSNYPGFPGYFNDADVHAYAEEGTYGTTVTMYDYWGQSASQTGTSSVSDAALSASGTSLSGTEGSTLTGVVAQFSDADPSGTTTDYSASINWGDGSSPTSGTIGSGFTVSGSHVYGAPGNYTVSVSIADAGGATASATGSTTIGYAAPHITSLSSHAGTLAGGNTVDIFGSYFNGVSSVKFGTTSATFTYISNTEIAAKAPAHAAGLVDVHVTTPGGTTATVTADHYTYVAAPKVTVVSPKSGTHLGGTTVTVTGANFSFVTSVLFGSTPGSGIHVLSSTKLTVVSPAHAAGTVDIRVKTAGGISPIATADKYKFI